LFTVRLHLYSRRAGDTMQAQSRCYAARQNQTELPSVDVDTETRHRGKPLVKG
jgi:hypothetical protein